MRRLPRWTSGADEPGDRRRRLGDLGLGLRAPRRGGLDHAVREVLLQPGYVLDDQSTQRGREIKEHGRQFYDGKYKAHFDNLFSSAGDWFRAFGNIPFTIEKFKLTHSQ